MEGRLGRDSGLTGIKSLAFPAFTCTTMDDSLSRIEELGEVTEVTELPLIGRNPRPDHPRLARDFIRSHHPRKILMQGICGLLDSGVFMHLSSIHSPWALSCSQYSAVASTTAGGGTNPGRRGLHPRPLPSQAALDHPRQEPGPLVFALVRQLGIRHRGGCRNGTT